MSRAMPRLAVADQRGNAARLRDRGGHWRWKRRAPSALSCLCSGATESESAGAGVGGKVERGETPRRAGAAGRGAVTGGKLAESPAAVPIRGP